jgi:hypothetical protein
MFKCDRANSYQYGAVDVDRDGHRDLVVMSTDVNSQPVLSVLPGNGDGTFRAPVDTPAPGLTNVFGFVAADFNGDGKPDVAALQQTTDTVFVFINTSH